MLVVWDFDWSLVNENSDTFVLRELAPALTDEMKQLQAERPAIFGKGKWTALMDHLLTKLGEEHMVSRRQIEHCLEGIPVFVEVIQVVRELAGRGCEQRILSDANSVFIDEVLRAACLQRHFSAVATNFGAWEPYAREDHDDHETHNDDILRVAPYQPRDRPHGSLEVERLEIHVCLDEFDERIQRVVGSAPTILSIRAVLSIRASSWQRAVAQRQRHERRRRLGLARRGQRRDGLEAIDLAVEVHTARLRAAMGAAQALDCEAQRRRAPREGLRWDLILLVGRGAAAARIWSRHRAASSGAPRSPAASAVASPPALRR